MRSLSLELRGAYNTLLDLIYDRGGPVPDDDRWLAGNMGVTVRRWKQLRAELVSTGRIVARIDAKGAVLSDDMAEQEIEIQKTRREKNAVSGASGGRRSAANRVGAKEINDIAEATAQAGLKLDTETDTVEQKEPNGSSSPASPDDVRAAFDEWNTLAKRLALPLAKSLSAGRRKRLKARLAHGGLDVWREALRAIEASKFCRGMKTDFRADLDFLLQERSFQRVIEDYYGHDAPRSVDAPVVPVSPETHAQHLAHFAATGDWRPGWGDRPDKPETQAA